MKKIDIINAVNALAGVAINKIRNEKVKFTLVFDYRLLRREARDFENDQQEVIKKFQADFEEELTVVKNLRSEGKPVTGHDLFLKAEKDTDKVLAELAQEPCEIAGLKTVSLEEFLKAVGDTDLSMEAISSLDGIVIE
jgi:hypothetical protein